MDIQGFLTVVTVDGAVWTATLNDWSLAQAKNVMVKPTMDGTGDPQKLVGQKSGTLTCNGQVNPDDFPNQEVTWGKDVAVAFQLQMGELGGDSDAGYYTGNVTLSSFDIETSADDAINFTLTGDTDTVEYTLPAP